jgi:hypothetical protein
MTAVISSARLGEPEVIDAWPEPKLGDILPEARA